MGGAGVRPLTASGGGKDADLGVGRQGRVRWGAFSVNGRCIHKRFGKRQLLDQIGNGRVVGYLHGKGVVGRSRSGGGAVATQDAI